MVSVNFVETAATTFGDVRSSLTFLASTCQIPSLTFCIGFFRTSSWQEVFNNSETGTLMQQFESFPSCALVRFRLRAVLLLKIALSSADYPVWEDTISLPAGTTFQYKYIKKTASGEVSQAV
jgi:Starch binding domain